MRLIHYSRCLLALLAFSNTAPAQELNLVAPPDDQAQEWTLKTRQSFYSYAVESKRIEARVAGVGLDLLSRRKLTEVLSFDLDAGLRLENGSHKSLDITEFSPNQQVLLHQGLLNYSPFSFLQVRFGGINQGHLKAPLLIDEVVFVGAQEKLSLAVGEYEFFTSLQQLIPNNRNLSTRLGTIDEGTPQFLSYSLGAKLGGDLLSLELEGTIFSYKKLSPSVAHQSRFLGNSVRGVASDSAEFDYNYKGHHLHARLKWYYSDEGHLGLTGQYLFNSDAPDGRNQGWLGSVDFGLNRYFVEFKAFSLQSDASLAFYNAKVLGHNNRRGESVLLGMQTESGQLSLSGTRARLIRPNIFQAPMDLISFNYTHFFSVLN